MEIDAEQDKFEQFDKLCEAAKKGQFNLVIIANPKVLGDNYEEIIQNLNKIAKSALSLRIAGTC